MSEIRMCDNCGTIFSVNAQGWTEYTKRTTLQDHPFNHGMEQVHMCVDCSGTPAGVKPRLPAIEA
jgi:hypothetical protein